MYVYQRKHTYMSIKNMRYNYKQTMYIYEYTCICEKDHRKQIYN